MIPQPGAAANLFTTENTLSQFILNFHFLFCVCVCVCLCVHFWGMAVQTGLMEIEKYYTFTIIYQFNPHFMI